MDQKDKERLKKVGIAALAALALIYVIYQIYMVTRTSVKTETAYSASVSESVDTDVFAVRKEYYLKKDRSGTLISIIGDGSRVGKGEEVAAVFADETEAANYSQITNLKEELDRYNRLNSQNASFAVDINSMNAKVSEDVIKMAREAESGSLTNLQGAIYDARDDAITEQIATGQDIDLEGRVSELSRKYAELSKESSDHTSIVSKTSGYYVSSADGYENTVDYDKVDKLSASQIDKIMDAKPAKVKSSVIGKVISDFDWYLICTVKSNRAGDLAVGDKVTVNFPYSAVTSIPATVASVSNNNSEKMTAVVLKCNSMSADIASLRRESAQLVINSFTGIKVSSSAIQLNDMGEKGVYIKEGNLVRFKKLDIIYNGDSYVLSKPSETSDYVSVYDNVILGGKGLYDGKVIS